MKNIVNEVKAEVKAEKKAAKQPRTIKVKSLVIFTIVVVISLVAGGYIGITANNAINSNIDHQVDAKVQSMLKDQK